jgi:hypothetical protein
MFKLKAASIYVILAVAVGMLAKHNGRGGIRWALLALVITPLFAGGLVLLLPRVRP